MSSPRPQISASDLNELSPDAQHEAEFNDLGDQLEQALLDLRVRVNEMTAEIQQEAANEGMVLDAEHAVAQPVIIPAQPQPQAAAIHIALDEENSAPYFILEQEGDDPAPVPVPTHTFANALIYDNTLAFKIWPVVFLGLLTHDFIMFYKEPNQRFGNTLIDVFFGLPLAHTGEFGRVQTNQPTWLNHMGSDNYQHIISYWGATVAIPFTMAATYSVQRVLRSRNNNANPPMQPARNVSRKKRALQMSAFMFALFAYMRGIESFAHKGKDTTVELDLKKVCENENKVFSFLNKVANFACTLYGEWDEITIPFNKMNDAQAYLDALLSENRDPAVITHRLEQLSTYSAFEKIDLSKQLWANWDDSSFGGMLAKFSSPQAGLNALIVKAEKETLLLTHSKIQSLTQFVQRMNVTHFDISNQLLNAQYGSSMVSGFNGTSITSLNLTNTLMGDKGGLALADIVSTLALEQVYLGHNLLTDQAIIPLTEKFPSSLKSVDYSSNDITDISLPAIIQTASRNQFHTLGIASLKEISSEAINESFKNQDLSHLRHLDVSSNGWGEEEFVAISAYLPAFNLESFDVSSNSLSSDLSAQAFFSSLNANTLRKLVLNKVNLSETGVKYFANFIDQSHLESVSLTENSINANMYGLVFESVFSSSVSHLDLSNNNLDEDTLELLMTSLKSGNGSLKSINLANNAITSDMAIRLIDVFVSYGIKDFNLASNLINNETCYAIAKSLKNSTFNKITLSNNLVDGECIASIINAAPGAALQSLIVNDILAIDDQSVISIVQDLVRSPYDVSYLGKDELNIDERRALNRASQGTSLIYMELMNAGLSEASKKRFALIESPAQFSVDNLKLTSDDVQNRFLSSYNSVNPAQTLSNQSTDTRNVLLSLSGGLLLLFSLYLIVSKSFGACAKRRNRVSHNNSSFFANAQQSLIQRDEENQICASFISRI